MVNYNQGMAEKPPTPGPVPEEAGQCNQAPVPLPGAERPGPPPVAFYGEYDEAGVDLSLLRYLLRLSPLDRLRLMEQHARETLLLYEYGRRQRERSLSWFADESGGARELAAPESRHEQRPGLPKQLAAAVSAE